MVDSVCSEKARCKQLIASTGVNRRRVVTERTTPKRMRRHNLTRWKLSQEISGQLQAITPSKKGNINIKSQRKGEVKTQNIDILFSIKMAVEIFFKFVNTR